MTAPARWVGSRRRGWLVGVVGLVFLGAGPPDAPVADAAQQQDTERVRTLLRHGADVNAAQGDGMTALHWAAVHDDAGLAQVLLYAGAYVEATTRLGGYTPLHLATEDARAAVVPVLLAAGARVDAPTTTGASPLHLAAAAGDAEIVRVLVAHGAGVDVPDGYSGRTPLMFATASGRLDAMAVLIESGAGVAHATRVVDYAEREREDAAARKRRDRILAAQRPPPPDSTAPDSVSVVPDSVAAPPDSAPPAPEPDRPEAAAPVDPDQPTAPDPNVPASPTAATAADSAAPKPLSYSALVGRQGGMTALHYAARAGRRDAVQMLLDAGAGLDTPTAGDSSTPLLVAILNGHYDLAMFLLAQGADPNRASEDGATPLFATLNQEWALRTWYPQPTASRQQRTTYLALAEALLEAGADPNARLTTHVWYAAYNAGRMGVDFAGATPMWRAAYATDVAAMRLLAAYGADPNIPTTKPASRRRRRTNPDSVKTDGDPSGLPPIPVGGPAVHPLHAASGVGYGTSRVGQQHRYVPDGWLPAVRFLVEEMGVDVNVRDHDGYTAVHNAAARGDNAMIEYLVSQGADVTLVSRRGQTTVDMANGPQQRVQPFPATIALLESLGATNKHNCLSC